MDDNLDGSRMTGRDGPARKRGRPPIPITEEVLERRRLSRQRVNASRPKREGPSRKRGRPRRAVAEVILQSPGVSGPTNTTSGCEGGEDGDASASQILPECSRKPGTSLAAGTPDTCTISDLNPPAISLQATGIDVPTRNVPTRKRGRPPIVVTDEVLEQRRLSRQRVNASRPKRECPSIK